MLWGAAVVSRQAEGDCVCAQGMSNSNATQSPSACRETKKRRCCNRLWCALEPKAVLSNQSRPQNRGRTRWFVLRNGLWIGC
jgi:hypothetical protein